MEAGLQPQGARLCLHGSLLEGWGPSRSCHRPSQHLTLQLCSQSPAPRLLEASLLQSKGQEVRRGHRCRPSKRHMTASPSKALRAGARTQVVWELDAEGLPCPQRAEQEPRSREGHAGHGGRARWSPARLQQAGGWAWSMPSPASAHSSSLGPWCLLGGRQKPGLSTPETHSA